MPGGFLGPSALSSFTKFCTRAWAKLKGLEGLGLAFVLECVEDFLSVFLWFDGFEDFLDFALFVDDECYSPGHVRLVVQYPVFLADSPIGVCGQLEWQTELFRKLPV